MRLMKDFLRDERGSHTVEFCIWIPLFMFFLAATIDASMIYLTHTEMWNVARDTARRITTGQIPADEADTYAQSWLSLGGNNHYWIQASDSGGEAVVQIRTSVQDASIFGIFGLIDNGDDTWTGLTLDAFVTMRMEPPVS